MTVRDITLRVVVVGDDLESGDLSDWVQNLNDLILSCSVSGDRKRPATPREETEAEAMGLTDDE